MDEELERYYYKIMDMSKLEELLNTEFKEMLEEVIRLRNLYYDLKEQVKHFDDGKSIEI